MIISIIKNICNKNIITNIENIYIKILELKIYVNYNNFLYFVIIK